MNEKDINNPDEAFLSILEKAIKGEKKWEVLSRIINNILIWTTWAARFLLLALSAYQINHHYDESNRPLVVFSIAFISMLNISLPVLSDTLRLEQRQIVYDRNTREYMAIKNELITGVISLEIAVKRFNDIFSKPTEKVIRDTHL